MVKEFKNPFLYCGFSDEDVSAIIAPILASLNCKESIPKLFELLITDNISPSRYAMALSVLIDEEYIPKLIQMYMEAPKEHLLDYNIIHILKNYKSSPILTDKINGVLNSTEINEKIRGIRLLPLLDIELRNSYFESLLFIPDEDILGELLFVSSLYFKNEFPLNQQIEDRLFDLLKNKKLGSRAADVLIEINNEKVIGRACKLLQNSKNDYEKINLCQITLQVNPHLAKEIIFDYLKKYNRLLQEPLLNALRAFKSVDLIPDILIFFTIGSNEVKVIILDCMKWILEHDETIIVSEEICEIIISMLEEQLNDPRSEFGEKYDATASFLVNNCPSVSKNRLLVLFNRPNYRYRSQLLEYINRLPMEKNDFTDETLNWLVKELEKPNPHPFSFYFAATVPNFLGKLLDDDDVIHILLPLLETENKILKNNVISTIQEIEKKLGKRIITH